MDSALKIVGFSTKPPRQQASISAALEPVASTWRAFMAGMQVLQRFADHAVVDVDAISSSNLQLLHRSLSRHARYNEQIQQIQQEANNTSLPIIRHLFAERSMTADLILVQGGQRINFPVLPQTETMYLLISGDARLETDGKTPEPVQHWWQKIGSNGNKNVLRSGAVIIPANEKGQTQLRAGSKPSLLLRINTLHLAEACEAAS